MLLLLPWVCSKSPSPHCGSFCFDSSFILLCFFGFWCWLKHGGSMAAMAPLVLFDVGICFLVHGSMEPAPVRPPPLLFLMSPWPPLSPPVPALLLALPGRYHPSQLCSARRDGHLVASQPRVCSGADAQTTLAHRWLGATLLPLL